MSEDNEPLTVTLKAGNNYDAPWIVIRAGDPETLKNRLNAVIVGDVSTLVTQGAIALQADYAAAKGLGATPVTAPPPAPAVTTAAPATSGWGWGTTAPTPPAGVSPAATGVPAAPAPTGQRQEVDKWGNTYTWNVPGAPGCPHGGRILKQGQKKDGSPYSAYICPQVDNFYRVQTDCKNIYA